MKIVLTVLLACALCAAADAQTKTDRESAGLLGAVRSVRTEEAELAPGEAEGAAARRVPIQAVTFDARGNRVRVVDFNRDGSASQTRVYTSDAEGRATGYEEFFGAAPAPRKHVYVLDEGGRRVEYKMIQPDGKPGEKYLYKYDERGRLVEASLFEHKGALISRHVYSYDGRGRLTAQTGYNADGTLASVRHSTYDTRGRLAELLRRDGHLLTYRVRYTYDGGRVRARETVGSVVEEDVPPSETHAPGRVVYAYKGKGRSAEAVVYNPDGSVRERMLIEYDPQGNWVKRTRLPQSAGPGHNVVPQRVEYRTIEYF